METRQLGRTRHCSSSVVFGAAAFWECDQETAEATLDLVVHSGINHIDVAPAYGMAETRLGAWLPAYRDRFFVGCKTYRRAASEAWEDLNRSLETLHIDAFDLYQAHRIRTVQDVDDLLAPGGAIEAFVRARDEGLTRFLGLTGHGLGAPAAQAEALDRFDFDTVMFPINPNLFANAAYRADVQTLLAKAAARQVGVLVIKSVAKTLWDDRQKTYQPWYEPFDTREKITEGIHFALSQPAVTAVVSTGEVRLLPEVVRAAERFSPMSKAQQEAVIQDWAAWRPIFPGPMG